MVEAPTFPGLFDILADSANLGYMFDSDAFYYFNREHHGQYQFMKLPEKVMVNHKSFVFPRNHFIPLVFERKIPQLVEAGITERILKEFEYSDRKSHDDKRKVLTIEHLSVGFKIWLLFLALSFGFFCLELLLKLFGKIIK